MRELKLWLFFLVLIMVGFTACGKKAKPVPPRLVVPKAVTDLKTDVRPGARYLVWSIPGGNTDGSRPADIKGFEIFSKTLKQGDEGCVFCDEGFELFAEVNLPRPKQGYVDNGMVYYPLPLIPRDVLQAIKVVSLNRHGWRSEPSNKIKVYGFDPLDPPNPLSFEPGAAIVTLKWKKPVPDMPTGQNVKVYGYRVYRQDSRRKWVLITPDVIKDLFYVDVGLHDWHPYRYAVTTLSIFKGTPWESRRSIPVSVVPGDYTPPAPVADFTAFPYQGGVQLTWQANQEPDLHVYRIHKLEVETGRSYLLELPPATTDYLDVQVMPGKHYVYTISAVDASARHNESKTSSEQKVFIP